jgi:hypothetical protein
MILNTNYEAVIIANGTVYKPKFINDSNHLSDTIALFNNGPAHFDKKLIYKFVVLANTGASNILVWPAGTSFADLSNTSKAISIPATGLVVGNEYDLSVAKITWNGTLTLMGYYCNVPFDYMDNY